MSRFRWLPRVLVSARPGQREYWGAPAALSTPPLPLARLRPALRCAEQQFRPRDALPPTHRAIAEAGFPAHLPVPAPSGRDAISLAAPAGLQRSGLTWSFAAAPNDRMTRGSSGKKQQPAWAGSEAVRVASGARGARVLSLQQLLLAEICVSSVSALCQRHDELFAIFSPLADGDAAAGARGSRLTLAAWLWELNSIGVKASKNALWIQFCSWAANEPQTFRKRAQLWAVPARNVQISAPAQRQGGGELWPPWETLCSRWWPFLAGFPSREKKPNYKMLSSVWKWNGTWENKYIAAFSCTACDCEPPLKIHIVRTAAWVCPVSSCSESRQQNQTKLWRR